MVLKVYTTVNCADCKAVKSYLSAMGVGFEEIVVNDLTEKAGVQEGVAVENGKGLVVGFKPKEIERLVSKS